VVDIPPGLKSQGGSGKRLACQDHYQSPHLNLRRRVGLTSIPSATQRGISVVDICARIISHASRGFMFSLAARGEPARLLKNINTIHVDLSDATGEDTLEKSVRQESDVLGPVRSLAPCAAAHEIVAVRSVAMREYGLTELHEPAKKGGDR